MADVNALKARQTMLQKKADLILATAERETRALTDAEKTELAALEQQIDGLTAQIDRTESTERFTAELDRITGGRGTQGTRGSAAPIGGLSSRAGSWGDQFVAATGEFFKGGGHRGGLWTSPSVYVPFFQATTLTEDPASGGALVQPQVIGPVPLPTRPLRVADIFAPGQTSTNTLKLMMETQFTNAAAPTAEGSAKPESALVFAEVDEPVRKIAHFLPVSTELLDDAPTMRSYIDGRLTLGVLLAEDDQLLNGNGTAPNVRGILNRSGLTATITQTTEAIADLIAAQIASVATASQLPVDAVVVNPSDWLKILTVKDTTGRYLAEGAPFVSMNPPMIWGVPAVITPAIAVKTILVAAGKLGGQVFRHTSGMRIDASNSHQDYFVKNLVAVRAEERVALAIYRASGFGKVVLA